MTVAEALPEITFDDYLHLEVNSDRRHEWVGGQVYAMTGGTERHDLLSALIYEALAPGARARGCRPFHQNRKVKLAEVAYYPDVLVACRNGFPPDRSYERDLSVVVEVLSPITERVDRTEKALAYAGAPSFEVYVLADPRRRRIEVGVHDGEDPTGGGRPVALRWSAHTSGLVPHLDVTVEDLYDRLDATALTD